MRRKISKRPEQEADGCGRGRPANSSGAPRGGTHWGVIAPRLIETKLPRGAEGGLKQADKTRRLNTTLPGDSRVSEVSRKGQGRVLNGNRKAVTPRPRFGPGESGQGRSPESKAIESKAILWEQGIMNGWEQGIMNVVLIKRLIGTVLLGTVASGVIGIAALRLGAPNASTPEKITTLDPSAQIGRPKPADASTTGALEKQSPSQEGLLPDGDARGQAFHVGDKLRIGFYERLDFEEEKWARQRPFRPAFQQRMEFSGEYTVSDDGTISLPLVGSFPVIRQTSRELETALAGSIETLLGRKGFVTIAALERQPIYVLGPVKNPGAYKYAAGMTVLHAVALAGGLDRVTIEPWQRIEAVRETGRRHGAIDRTSRLLARAAVLKSEQGGRPVEVPARLVEILGQEAAETLVAEQVERRKSVAWTRRSREAAARATVENAKNEVEALADRLQPMDESVKLRTERVDSMRTLMKSNVVSSPVFVQAQSELAEAQERRQSALTAVILAKQRFALAEQELARQQAETQAELERDLSLAEQDLADGERDLGASEGILNVIRAGSARRDVPITEANVAYELVRRGEQGPTVVPCTGTASLEPGDLVRVRQKNEADLRSSDAALR